MDLREEFVLKAKAPGANISALCREYGISRKTGHKWLARFESGGPQALRELSRRPHQTLNATDGELVLQIIEARHAHPRWGPKKLRAVLMRKGVSDVPTVRTIRLVRSRPGCPQDNGAHERMHEDIAFDLQLSPADDLETQQRMLDAWVEEFNHVRPHEALAMKVPADGRLRLDGQSLFVGSGVAGYDVAIHRLDDSTVRVLFHHLELARFVSSSGAWAFLDDDTQLMKPPQPKTNLRPD